MSTTASERDREYVMESRVLDVEFVSFTVNATCPSIVAIVGLICEIETSISFLECPSRAEGLVH